MLPTLAYGDAIGNNVIAINDALVSAGYDTDIFAEGIDKKIPSGTAKLVSAYKDSADTIILYHLSTGTELNEKIKKFKARVFVVYHNVTPPEFWHGYDYEHAFRCGIYQVVSFLTTTGLFNDDAAQWPHVTWVILAVCMFIGGCAGSTSGGFKVVRCIMLLKGVRNEFRQMLHPHAILPLRIGATNVPNQKRVTLLAFLTVYCLMCIFCAFTMIAAGVDNTNAITITISTLSNVGPTLGTEIGPTMSWDELPDFAKWICSLLMLMGRLEIFSVLIIFTPAFWKEQ